MKKATLTLLLLLSFCTVFGQKDSLYLNKRSLNSATLVGLGITQALDTYLSPIPYKGSHFSLLSESMRKTRYFDNRLSFQHQFLLHLAQTENPTSTAASYVGSLRYDFSAFYPIATQKDFSILAGASWNMDLGGIYNSRNSNNPASAQLNTNLNIGILALYHWKRFTFRWQGSTPIAGVFFLPPFAGSYYEIFELGNQKEAWHFGSFHNQWAFRNYLTVDIPVGKIILRTGYLGDFYRTKANHLTTRLSHHQFMLGLAMESLSFTHKEIKNYKINSSFY